MTTNPIEQAVAALESIRIFMQDCITNSHDRSTLSNLFASRDECDKAIAILDAQEAAQPYKSEKLPYTNDDLESVCDALRGAMFICEKGPPLENSMQENQKRLQAALSTMLKIQGRLWQPNVDELQARYLPAQPQGDFVMVPREPTEEMIEATVPPHFIGNPAANEGSKRRFFDGYRKKAREMWAQMIAVSNEPTVKFKDIPTAHSSQIMAEEAAAPQPEKRPEGLMLNEKAEITCEKKPESAEARSRGGLEFETVYGIADAVRSLGKSGA